MKSIIERVKKAKENQDGVILGAQGLGKSFSAKKGKLDGELNDRAMITTFIGKAGKGSKIITFKENEFKKELAPANVIIEQVEVNNEKCIRVTYTCN